MTGERVSKRPETAGDTIDRILSHDNILYTGREVRERLEAAGYVIVPKEPTGSMAYAGERAGCAYLADARADMTIREARPFITAEIYKAMIGAVSQ